MTRSDLENILIINMLRVEKKHETPFESKQYHYENISSHSHEPDHNQETTNYTRHVIETNSNMNFKSNKKYQKTTNKRSPLKEKTVSLLLESTKKPKPSITRSLNRIKIRSKIMLEQKQTLMKYLQGMRFKLNNQKFPLKNLK